MNRNITNHFRLLILLIGLFVHSVAYADWTPVIRHFTPKNYGAGTMDGQRRSNARPSFEHPILGEITTKYKQNHHFETFGFYCTFMSKYL